MTWRELTLTVQPQVRLATGSMFGAEALLRWHDAQLGEVSPGRFIAIDDILARTLISVGCGLGLDVLAEGVETEEQAEFLLREYCNEAQGFLFGRPMTAEQQANFESRYPARWVGQDAGQRQP